MGLKYAVEAVVIHHFTGRWLTPLDYFTPLLASRQAAVGHSEGLLLFLLAWTLPFLWIGVSMTVRRAEDAGWSPLVAVPLFFMPIVNYLFMLALCVLPSRAARRDLGHATPGVGGRRGRHAQRLDGCGPRGPHRGRDGGRQRTRLRLLRDHPVRGHPVRHGRDRRLRLQRGRHAQRGSHAGGGHALRARRLRRHPGPRAGGDPVPVHGRAARARHGLDGRRPRARDRAVPDLGHCPGSPPCCCRCP